MRARVGWWLRRLADRLDDPHAPRHMGHSFTFELGKGIVFRTDGRGCPLWYLSEADHDRAHTEADNPAPWINWKTMTLR